MYWFLTILVKSKPSLLLEISLEPFHAVPDITAPMPRDVLERHIVRVVKDAKQREQRDKRSDLVEYQERDSMGYGRILEPCCVLLEGSGESGQDAVDSRSRGLVSLREPEGIVPRCRRSDAWEKSGEAEWL